MTKRKYPKVGEMVRIDNPEVFIRCGYPMDLFVERSRIYEECGDQIREFIRNLLPLLDKYTYIDHTASEISKALAYYNAKHNGFGGNERKIYTEYHEALKGKIYLVHERKTVMTGVYNNGYSGYRAEEWDYQPPFLSKMKAHIILMLRDPKLVSHTRHNFNIAIEAIHVSIVEDEE